MDTLFEPKARTAAIDVCGGWDSDPEAGNAIILASIAVSLKRIADVLEGSERQSGLIYMLDQIAVGVQSK